MILFYVIITGYVILNIMILSAFTVETYLELKK
jgi:hypothetical protein